MAPILHDAVTLRHFACVAQLPLCERRHGAAAEPRWTSEVRAEVSNGRWEQPSCADVLAAAWLGEPIEPEIDDLEGIFKLQVALNRGRTPPTGDKGEAESIFFAERLGGRFMTDDNAAYDFAKKRLGSARVFDTVRMLQEAAADGELSAREAVNIVEGIRSAGRHLRRTHPSPMHVGHF